MSETTSPVPRKYFWDSHRFWAMVAAVGGGIPTTTAAVVAGVALVATNPVLGIAALVGALVSLAGTAGMAYYGFKSPGTVTKDKTARTASGVLPSFLQRR